jgi:hypothetical protein
MPYKPTGRPSGRPRKSVPPPDGTLPHVSARQWQGLQAETQPFLDGLPPLPIFVEQTTEVAHAAGVTQRTVQRWRHDELYHRGFLWLVRFSISDLQHLHSNRQYVSEQRILEIHAWLGDHWRGPVTSPLDGQTYPTSEEFAAHLVRAKAFHPDCQFW